MTQEKIIEENNKLIAEFMGGKPMGGFVKNISEMDGYSFRNKNYTFRELKYHSSWEWLMPVVEKINKLKDGIYKISISPEWTGTQLGGRSYNDENDSSIIQTHKTVIEFIKSHNQNKK